MVANRLLVGAMKIFIVALLVYCWAGKGWAAGEWEWTAGQGWVMGAGSARPTPKAQLDYAYELEQKGEFMDSARQYFLLVQSFPDSKEAGIGLQRLARCLFEMENYYTSYKAIEQVIKTYPNTGKMSDLVEIELRIAKKMMMSQTPDILGGKNENSRDANIRRGLEIVNSVVEHDPYGPVAAEAYLVKGEGHLFLGEIKAAREAFDMVLEQFPKSDSVERARLGLLTCDSLMGQAKPQELKDQMDLLLEEEAARKNDPNRNFEDDEELDNVENSIRKMAEVEAEKMMTQAAQYRQMGGRKHVQAAEFLYKEVVRRYPGTPQAEEAMELSGGIVIPKDPGKIAKGVRNIKLNPFTWNKDPEPPWIVPKMSPDDMVMVDDGLGPIVGVPETGMPQAGISAGVRPAAMGSSGGAGVASGGFSPIGSAPVATTPQQAAVPAPSFIDAVGNERDFVAPPLYSQRGGMGGGMAPLPPSFNEPPANPAVAFNSRSNPLPTISADDLILDGAQSNAAGQYNFSDMNQNVQGGSTPYYATPSQPSLNGIGYNTPMSDLVGPARRNNAPLPEYVTGGYPPAGSSGNYYQEPGYQNQGYNAAPPPVQNGGWTLSNDFR